MCNVLYLIGYFVFCFKCFFWWFYWLVWFVVFGFIVDEMENCLIIYLR